MGEPMMMDSDYEHRALQALREAVAEALDRKRRLGQYAVVWRDDGPALIGSDVPPELRRYRREAPGRSFGVADSGDPQ